MFSWCWNNEEKQLFGKISAGSILPDVCSMVIIINSINVIENNSINIRNTYAWEDLTSNMTKGK